MRAPLALLATSLLAACAATSHDDAAPAATSSQGTDPAPGPTSAAPGAPAAPGSAPSAPPSPAPDCSLPALGGNPDVSAAFLTYAPPSVAPAATTGGTLAGEYVVEKATVYLPSGSAGLVDAQKSTGKVAAWAVFQGARYRLHLHADFTIVTVIGPQSQGTDTDSQGGFTTKGATLTLDHACDTAIADEADYTFADDGAGRATIVVRTPTSYGDTYLELDAIKSP